jgi:uncharacterized protein
VGPELAPSLAAKLAKAESLIQDMGSVLVAFSGGADSALVLRLAAGSGGVRHVALTTHSPTTPPDDLEHARALAKTLGSRHIVVQADELATPGYAENAPNRCYLCKQTLYPVCVRAARDQGCHWIADGVNTDDLKDYRPGLKAAEEFGVRHPLVEAGISKNDVRALSRWLGLPTADKPASPCLSSRFPYGTRITHDALARVATAEAEMRALGFRDFRVRYLGTTARVEVSLVEQTRLTNPATAAAVRRRIGDTGFTNVVISPAPLRSGSLNDELPVVSLREAGARSEDPSVA